ncbi:hypothetical protein GCM10011506_27980 [Marivirga lumbricoides]|uniref:YD repeat-containing protein n=1 Tax=Marivirga lumbricoides TaxID=1046115 RepID=A0ABQ1MHG8_9BACT|nr:hypothetical protein GCM10011506_27980 [Marivirga lumbricoides]
MRKYIYKVSLNLIAVFIILIIPYVSDAQITESNKQIIPASPNAASLGNYANYPVNEYTGVPQISIPIYTIQSGDITLPISVSYHASGVRVSQEASSVGLGWALNAGGVITRQVRGLDDFKSSNGYIFGDFINGPFTNFTFTNANTPEDQILDRIANGSLDGSPDLYNFNFFNHSGKMVVPKQNESVITALSINQNNLKIEYDLNQKSWMIVDGNGWRYTFSAKEYSRSFFKNQKDNTGGNWSESNITAWYLTKVENLNGDFIELEYISSGKWIESQEYYNEEITGLNTVDKGIAHSEITNPGSTNVIISKSQHDELYLKKILFNEGYMDFDYIDRRDRVSVLNSTKAKGLKKIHVYSSQNNNIVNYDFKTSYFNNNMLNSIYEEAYLRLRLDEITEYYYNDNDQEIKKPPYKFNYNSRDLPSKISESIDHYGYYNGASVYDLKNYKFERIMDGSQIEVHDLPESFGNTRQPFFSQVGKIDDTDYFILKNGMDREPNEQMMKAAVLEEIINPLLGRTKFIYEPNQYYDPNAYDIIEEELIVTDVGNNQVEIDLEEPTLIFLEFDLTNHNFNGDPYNVSVMNNMRATIENSEGNEIIRFIPTSDQEPGSEGNNVPYMNSDICVFLDAGIYEMKVDDGGYEYLEMLLKAKILKQIPNNFKLGAGLRVKAVEEYDKGHLIKKEKYEYSENAESRSSGRLLSKLGYTYRLENLLCAPYAGGNSIIHVNNYPFDLLESFYLSTFTVDRQLNFYSYSSSIRPISTSAQGNSIGYNRVKKTEVKIDELSEDNLDKNGYSIIYFKNFPDEERSLFPGMVIEPNLDNGKIEMIQTYNSENIKIKEKKFNYGDENVVKVSGIIPFKSNVVNPCENLGVEVSYRLGFWFDVESKWSYNTGWTEDKFDENGIIKRSTYKIYEYDNESHKNLTAEIFGFENTSQKITYEYPGDYPTQTDMTTEDFDKMVNELHVLDPVIKTTINEDDNLQNILVNNYEVNGDPRLISSKSYNVVDGSFDQNTSITYSTNGKVKEVVNKDGVKHSYIWGYNNSYPIVEGIGIDISSLTDIITNASGSTDLENFWADLGDFELGGDKRETFYDNIRMQLGNEVGDIKIYTYDPLIGMTSQADMNDQIVFYEYDDYNRLSLIRNTDGEIIKKISYSYR